MRVERAAAGGPVLSEIVASLCCVGPYDPDRTEPKKIAESVSRTGFSASVKEPKDKDKE